MSGEGLDREAVRRRAEAATPGPWWCEELDEGGDTIGILTVETPCEVLAVMSDTQAPIDNADNAEFIAHARTDVPALLDALEAAEAARKELRRRLNERFTMARTVLAAEGLDHVAALVPVEEVLSWIDELEGVRRTEGGAS